MLKRKFKARARKVPVDPELRLAEIEVELEAAYEETERLEQTEPPYDGDDPSGSWEKYRAHMRPAWEKTARLGREKRMLMTPEFEELSDYGDVMSLEHWLECVNCGGFIDYDGHGRYVRDGKESNIEIYPSDVEHNSIRKDFDTIIWFNR
jgi:hypothetical protein